MVRALKFQLREKDKTLYVRVTLSGYLYALFKIFISVCLFMRLRSFALAFVFLFVSYSAPLLAQSCPAQGEVIFPGISGQQLLDSLVTKYKPTKYKSYNVARDILYSKIDNVNGYVYGIYTGYKAAIPQDSATARANANTVSINAEHTWPQSMGATDGTQAHSDMNHLRPSYTVANSARGNAPFAEIPDNETNTWYLNSSSVSTPIPDSLDKYSEKRNSPEAWEPREAYKGDVARGMFYFYTMYKGQADAADPDFFDTQKEYLRIWNSIDSVSSAEHDRTCAIAPYQDGKVNPFVVDPTLVDRAFFDGVSAHTNVQFKASGNSVSETPGILMVNVEVSLINPNPDTATTVGLSITGGTATPDVDFDAFTTQTITFDPGSTQAPIFQFQIYDDDEEESSETIILSLQNISGPANAQIGAMDTYTITIEDDDGVGPVETSNSSAWINEFHYDNVSTDANEFVEIAAHTGLKDMSTLTLTLYNGSGGSSYGSYSGSDFILGGSSGDVNFYYLEIPGIQNGAPDGMSLDIDGNLVQFLSYEGAFTASGGPANGVLSTNIGVEETGSTEATHSLSLIGSGKEYEDFTWAVTTSSSKGSVNDGQTIEFSPTSTEPSIYVLVDGVAADSGAIIDFGGVLVDNSSSKTITITNIGDTTLAIADISNSNISFTGSALSDDSLSFNESAEITLTFSPIASGDVSDTITIESNASNVPVFKLMLKGKGIQDGEIIPISEARGLAQGTRVTISGIVTVAEDFRGPMYFQDATGGIAWYNDAMRDANNNFLLDVQRGDSIVISGELGNYNDLIQIVGNDPEYSFYDDPATKIIPEPITMTQMNSGNYEGQLVSVQVQFADPGALQGNTNYDISDDTGTGQLRVSAFTDIVGSIAPDDETTIVGVVGVYKGDYQLLPRDLKDIGAEEIVIPGADTPKAETFDIVTWNLRWFGDPNQNPADDDLQLQNVKTVIDSIGADVYALQEVANTTKFSELLNTLSGYGGFVAGSPYNGTQKTAFLFRRETIDSVSSAVISDGFTKSKWANGRYPLEFKIIANLEGFESREFYLYDIHLKATFDSPDSDYDQRQVSSQEFKAYLDTNRDRDNVIVLGDYNDEMGTSVVSGKDSPFKNFVDDMEYSVVTKNLEDKGFSSHSGGAFFDHITFTSELEDEYFQGTENVQNTSYVSSYLSTTSDHYPILVRFKFPLLTSNEFEAELPTDLSLSQNYPNPFNPSTMISYQLPVSGEVSLKIFDMLGREVATLVNGRQSAGKQEVRFDAAGLSSGIYLYRLNAGGEVLTRKMLLVK